MERFKRLAADRARFRRVALFSLLLFFAAHAFCFFNLTYSSGSVMLHVSSGRSAQISAGSYLQPVYWRIRGDLSAPLFVGLLSASYLTLTAAVCALLLRIRNPLALFALCGALTVNPAIVAACAGSLHTADAAFLSTLLAALAAVCCLRMRFGACIGALLIAGALALDPAAGSFFAGLSLIALLTDLIEKRDSRALLRGAVRVPATLLIGAALYGLGDFFLLRRSGLAQQAVLQTTEGGLTGAWLAPIRALLAPLTAYATLNVVLRVLLVVLVTGCLIVSARALGASCMALPTLGALLLPLACNLPCFSDRPISQITPAYCLLDVFVIAMLCKLAPNRARLQKLAAGAFSVLFLGVTVFSNQVYLKKNLEFESTLSLMTRVVHRAEATEGYRVGHTPVAIVGAPEDSVFSVGRKGFEHLAALDAAANNTAIATDADTLWYVWEVLGYPFNFVSTFELEQIKQDARVKALPAFPAEGACTIIDGTLVIKLS